MSNITDTNDIVIAGTTPDLYSHEDFALLRASSFANFPTLTSGEFSNALAFDASQTNVATTGGGVPIFNYTNYSVSMWLNGQPQPQLRVFSNSSTNNGNPLFTIGTETSGFFPYASIFIRNDAGTVMINNLSSSNFVFDGNWHHVVWVDQNGYGLLYIDGVLDPVSFSYTRSGTFTMNTTTIGGIVRGTVGNCFSGNIDDVAVWNRRLTYSEIQSLQTNPPPAPTQILPPGIVSLTTSADPTNNTYIGDTFSLTVQATGTAPLNYQWLLNGQPISAGTNATATNSIFVLSPAQATDSGAYSVVVSNSDPILPGGGSVTSTVVQVTVQTFTPITNGVALSLDVDAVGTTNTQPGFQMYNTSLAGSAFNNGIRVNISGVGTALADRVRTTSPNVTNGPGMTQAQIYNDFIFANSTNGGTGLNIALSHLVPSTPYAVTIWSFDAVSTGPATPRGQNSPPERRFP